MAVIQEKNKSKWTKDGRSWYFDTYYINEFGFPNTKKSELNPYILFSSSKSHLLISEEY